ncbi:MAG: FISUMP domain-containing protein [Bacteroidales bacterium]|nr:FISUMP domain-containing protein [Bacteroidales bacterium]
MKKKSKLSLIKINRIRKTFILFVLLSAICVSLKAQNLTLTFADKKEILNIEYVKATNLRTCDTVTFTNNEVYLHDVSGVGIKSAPVNTIKTSVYPNPFAETAKLQYYSPANENIEISIINLMGQMIGKWNKKAEEGINIFEFNIMNKGVCIMQIKSSSATEKIMLLNIRAAGCNEIKNISNSAVVIDEQITDTGDKKSRDIEVLNIDFIPGDFFKFDCISGVYGTILTDSPKVDKKYEVAFYDCADGDGNNYKTLTIGNQVWMAENLRTTKYSKGESIPKVTDNGAWSSSTTPAYCWLDHDSVTNFKLHGALYNWFVIDTGNVCPSGWDVPSDDDWDTLETYLGATTAGGKLKDNCTGLWLAVNKGATNESGFTMLPSTLRGSNGWFNIGSRDGYWWTSTEVNATIALCKNLYWDSAAITTYNSKEKKYGFSIRCILKK